MNDARDAAGAAQAAERGTGPGTTDAGGGADSGTGAGTGTSGVAEGGGGAAPVENGAPGPAGGDREAGAGPETGGSGQDGGAGADADGGGGTGADGGTGEGRRPRAAVAVESGAALTGKAAELLAAVRAVERGERDAAAFFPAPARAPAPPPVREAEPAPGARAVPGAGGRPRQEAPARPPEPTAEAVAAVREVLAGGGAPEALAAGAAAQLGDGAAEALRADPWQLLAVPGVRPSQADEFARGLLESAEPGDGRRVEALVGWLLAQAALRGHTALDLPAVAAALTGYGVPDAEEALRAAAEAGGVLVFEEREEPPAPAQAAEGEEEAPVRLLLGLERYAMAEEGLADGLSRLVNTFTPPAGPPADGGDGTGADAAAWEAAAGGAPSASAAELIRAVAGGGLVLHTGGEAARAEPAALVAAARALGLRAYAAAHTDDGRARLAALLAAAAPAGPVDDTPRDGPAPGGAASGPPAAGAVTVRGLLAGREGPGRDADGLLAVDVLAVLDAPQLDAEVAAALVEALPDGARLVLSGDPGLLESAGPGRVFADVAAARICPRVTSRTPDPGPIGELVSGVGVGELQAVAAPGKEVVIVPVQDPGEAVHRTVQLVADSVPRALGVPAADTQVIAVGHGGAAGTRVLNAALKERLNPGPGAFGGFDPGDRVVYVPAPGTAVPGTVASGDDAGLHLDCGGTPVVVRPEQAGEAVRHGWALTAHQAAGRRWPAAVVVVPGDAEPALSRAWAYTAFSRGERHLSVVHGAGPVLARRLAEVPAPPRTTRLRGLLGAQSRG
ncbi:helix-hairpin-helix domain-containing protein [Streptomyces sp. MAR4 CNX-425]|uniref:helix-hairpin-helix domain-containing protein n=1 Tax=Streptomyces sp. MAR4 CNX-425 TaxID=3406343 RepID=UPI003B5065BE